jgi:hypothetical protein
VGTIAASATGDPALAWRDYSPSLFYTEAAVHGGVRINQMTDNTMTADMLGIKACLRVLLSDMLDEQSIETFRVSCAEVIRNYPDDVKRDAMRVIDNLLDVPA